MDGPNTEATAAAVADNAATVRIKVKVPRIVRGIGVKRPRPVDANRSSVVKLSIHPETSSGKEKSLAVLLRGEKAASNAVLRDPLVGGICKQLVPLGLARRVPAAAPFGYGGIILGQQGGQVVGEAVEAILGIIAVFGYYGTINVQADHKSTITILIGIPVVSVLCLRLTPGEVVAVGLRLASPNIAGSPKGAARQAEINIFVAVV